MFYSSVPFFLPCRLTCKSTARYISWCRWYCVEKNAWKLTIQLKGYTNRWKWSGTGMCTNPTNNEIVSSQKKRMMRGRTRQIIICQGVDYTKSSAVYSPPSPIHCGIQVYLGNLHPVLHNIKMIYYYQPCVKSNTLRYQQVRSLLNNLLRSRVNMRHVWQLIV